MRSEYKNVRGINNKAKIHRCLRMIAILLIAILLLVACKQTVEDDGIAASKEYEIETLKEELSQISESNQSLQNKIVELEGEVKSALEANESLAIELEKFKEKIDNSEESNENAIQYYTNFISYFKYEDYDVVDFDVPLYRYPDDDSEIIFDDRARGFIKSVVQSDNDEEWYAIEMLYTTEPSIMNGYIKKSGTEIKYVELPYNYNKDVLVKNHYIGESISVFNVIATPLISVHKGELLWYVDDGEVVYGFNPINWRINSINIIGEGNILDGKYSIGDNAEEAIDYYSEKYEMLYLGDAMSESSDNIIKLSDGYLLIIMYNTGMLTSKSVITEIKIFNEGDMP